MKQYYETPLGQPRPHRGGHWLKTLSILENLSIFWAATDDPDGAENELLATFVKNVSQGSKEQLLDPDRPLPFANLEYPKGNRKKHGIARQAAIPL
ncbi:MAG: hypothetical protein ACYCX4_09855 [Bacillota bacterium]